MAIKRSFNCTGVKIMTVRDLVQELLELGSLDSVIENEKGFPAEITIECEPSELNSKVLEVWMKVE